MTSEHLAFLTFVFILIVAGVLIKNRKKAPKSTSTYGGSANTSTDRKKQQ